MSGVRPALTLLLELVHVGLVLLLDVLLVVADARVQHPLLLLVERSLRLPQGVQFCFELAHLSF